MIFCCCWRGPLVCDSPLHSHMLTRYHTLCTYIFTAYSGCCAVALVAVLLHWLLCCCTGCCAVALVAVLLHWLLCCCTGCCAVALVAVLLHWLLCCCTGCCAVALVAVLLHWLLCCCTGCCVRVNDHYIHVLTESWVITGIVIFMCLFCLSPALQNSTSLLPLPRSLMSSFVVVSCRLYGGPGEGVGGACDGERSAGQRAIQPGKGFVV